MIYYPTPRNVPQNTGLKHVKQHRPNHSPYLVTLTPNMYYLSPKYINNKLFSYIEKNYSNVCQRVYFPNISFSFLQIECSNGLYGMCIKTRFHSFYTLLTAVIIFKKAFSHLSVLKFEGYKLKTTKYWFLWNWNYSKCKTGIPFPLWTVFVSRPYSTCIYNYFEALTYEYNGLLVQYKKLNKYEYIYLLSFLC